MPATPAPVIDLSKIDFEALRIRFKESKHKNTDLEALKSTLESEDFTKIKTALTRLEGSAYRIADAIYKGGDDKA